MTSPYGTGQFSVNLDRFKTNGEVYKQPSVKLPRLEGGYKPPKLGRDFYYVVCKHEGRYVLLGPENTEEEAYAMGASKLHTVFKVVSFPTRDRAEATRQLRHAILDSSSDLGLSLRRMKHQV